MDDKKKIVLATEDILARKLEDIFINVNLQQKFNIIKRERLDNNFDLAQQFRAERNASRDFRVYGIIDSPIIDCDNLTIKVYSETSTVFGAQILSNLIYSTTSQPIGFGDKNVFGKMRGKYMIPLNNYQVSDKIYIQVLGDGVTFDTTVIEQTLVFKDADDNFVEYGTETVDVGINGQIVEINNNFPFFYNKHWIKNNFQIEKVSIRDITFDEPSYSMDEGESLAITLRLSEPSVFGTETVEVILTTPDVEAYDTAAPGLDFSVDTYPYSLPIIVNWSVGEQVKEIDITALADSLVEKGNEIFTIALNNPQNATINQGLTNITETTVTIGDTTPKVYVTYNFQKMIKQITPVTTSTDANLGQLPGFEMNLYGAQDYGGIPSTVNNENFRFFHNDNFELTIKNEGETTLLPIIPGVTTSEQVFAPGATITMTIENKYQNHDNLQKESAVFDFKEKDVYGILGGVDYYSSVFYINGVRFGPAPLVADNFVATIYQKYNSAGIEPPFEIFQNNKVVTLTTKHPANNVNGLIPQKIVGLFGTPEYALEGFTEVPDYPAGRVMAITDQIPFELQLYANANNATTCNYSFTISKPGYKSVNIAPTQFVASSPSNKVYLVTPIKDVVGPTLPVTDPAVCDLNTNALDSNGYYVNGVALIAASIFGYNQSNALNQHTSGFAPTFRQNPLTANIIACNGLIGLSKNLS